METTIPPNVIPQEAPISVPEQRPETEKNIPFHTSPEVKPIYEPKTYPDKKEKI